MLPVALNVGQMHAMERLRVREVSYLHTLSNYAVAAFISAAT